MGKIAAILIRVRRLAAGLVSCFIAQEALCQPVAFVPTTPNSRQVIQVHVAGGGACVAEPTATVRSGSVIRTTIDLYCVIGPPGYWNVRSDVGPFPPGEYIYEIYLRYGSQEPPELYSRVPLVVTAAPPQSDIPMIDEVGKGLLLLLLAICGAFTARRGFHLSG
jgi:hypothetical protein